MGTYFQEIERKAVRHASEERYLTLFDLPFSLDFTALNRFNTLHSSKLTHLEGISFPNYIVPPLYSHHDIFGRT